MLYPASDKFWKSPRITIFIAEFAAPPSKSPLRNIFYFDHFSLYRVHLGDLSTYCIDFLLLIEYDLRSFLGWFILKNSRMPNNFGVLGY